MRTVLFVRSEDMVERALFRCDHASAAWFGSNLGFLANAHPNLNVIEWWKSFMELCASIVHPINASSKAFGSLVGLMEK